MKKIILSVALIIILESCYRNIYIPTEEIQSPLTKKGDCILSYSPSLSNYIYSNFSLSYSPMNKIGVGLSTVRTNFYYRNTASIGYYSNFLAQHPEKRNLYSGFLSEIWLHVSDMKLKEGNYVDNYFFGNFYASSFDAMARSYKVDFGFNYIYNYVHFTIRPKLTMIDVTKIISRSQEIHPSLVELKNGDPFTFVESTFKMSIGTTRAGIFGGANMLFGSSPNYFEKFNIFVGGKINITEFFTK